MNQPGENQPENKAMDRPSERPAGPDRRGVIVGVCALLAVAVFLVFGRTLQYEFVNYDDGLYVYQNPEVVKGLTFQGTVQVFTHIMCDFYHPLTMLSLMLDDQIYGLNAGGYHLTNVLLHAATTVLLFLVLRRMMSLRSEKSVGTAATPAGTLWPCAFVAAVFAIHPLRVESVAWVTERKDMLSGLFFMLTLGAYVRYVEKSKVHPSPAVLPGRTGSPKSRVWYGLMLLSFTLGLLSKPSLVTLPFVLLLLDYWPLQRFTFWPVFREKLPLFVLSAAVCVATVLAQQKTAIISVGAFPLPLRLGNAAVSYVVYLGRMFYPAGLAVVYPYPEKGLPLWEIVLALVLLTGITAGVLALRSKRPYLLVGWLWYLGMLVPNIGVVQAGIVARADRFTYLSQIGLYLAIVWAIRDLTVSWRYRRQVLCVGALMVITVLMVYASIQTSYWRDTESLWNHTLACTSGNYVGHNSLGNGLAVQGRSVEAIEHYQKAIEIKPNYAEAYYNLGRLFAGQGRFAEAIGYYQRALEIKPNLAEAHYNLGIVLDRQGKPGEAIDHYQKALAINPDYAEAHNNLGMVLARQGQSAEAIRHFQQALEIKPDYAEAHNNLGNALGDQGRYAEAAEHYRKAIEFKRDYAEAYYNLGNALALQGKYAEAIGHFQKALQFKPDDVNARNSLDAALGLLNQSVKGTRK
ncbi:MAG: tetratricopeptide repeat protein [Verrucomicrobiota bacterium]|jgi:tetratricopeptide (TPR) repeat protein